MPPLKYKGVHRLFDKWLYLEPRDHEALDVIWVAALDRDLPGDPLWLYVIAPSGGCKSEWLVSLSGFPRIYTLSALTPQTLISGKLLRVPGSKTKDNPKGDYELGGILKLLDGQVLVIKDLTVLLSMRDTDRFEIYSQFRDSYDGKYEKAFGTTKNPVRVFATYGFIAGVTPAIDVHQKAATMLGQRFLKVRSHPDEVKVTERAFANAGKEEIMRKELMHKLGLYLRRVSKRCESNLPPCNKDVIKQTQLIARYIARMRAWVFVTTYQGKLVDINIVEPEAPTRVVKQLQKLSIGLAIIREHSEVQQDDMVTIQRVAKDTAIPKRQRIVDVLMNNYDPEYYYTNIASLSGLHYNSVRIECEKMRQLGILWQKKVMAGGKEVLKFFFTDGFVPLAEAVYGRPVPEGARYVPDLPEPSPPEEEPTTTSLDDEKDLDGVFADFEDDEEESTKKFDLSDDTGE
jgi:hypothetical protein